MRKDTQAQSVKICCCNTQKGVVDPVMNNFFAGSFAYEHKVIIFDIRSPFKTLHQKSNGLFFCFGSRSIAKNPRKIVNGLCSLPDERPEILEQLKKEIESVPSVHLKCSI